MAPLTPKTLALTLLLLLFLGQTTAHFLLNYPPTIGFDDDAEGTPPCGSFTADFSKDNVTNFHVGGDFIALTSTHPAATWLFRATLDQTASGNWTDLAPAVSQTGLGLYCETDLKVPEAWAGSKGIVNVVQDAADGLLFQCAAVKFVTGSNAPSGMCKNVTGLTASYTAATALSSIPATAAATSSSAAATGTGKTTSGTSTSEAQRIMGGLFTIVGLMAIGSVTLGASLML